MTIALLLAVAAPVFAQAQSPGVDRREHRQKERIKEGVRSGELTRQEARHLAGEQAAIRAEERAMKADGVLTPQERQKLQRDLDRSSQHIKNKKHNAQTR
jgi:uncharacterized membrane protein